MANNSEYKVTYLLGAGASANALPTVKKTETTEGLSTSLRHFQDYLHHERSIASEHKSFVDEISSDLIWLADKSDEFGTTDTFAKYLYLKDKVKLKKLKRALSFYFSKVQIIDNAFDNRALVFLTSVLQNDDSFPSNIKILSWNYDFQLQLAANSFIEEKFTIFEGGGTSAPVPLIKYYPYLGGEITKLEDESHYRLVHLNGIAGFYKPEKYINDNCFRKKHNDITGLISEVNSSNYEPLLTFAWENGTFGSSNTDSRLIIAKQLAINTDILVIIGYSFPFFNRKIDAAIFDVLKSSGNLKKIYFQDPYRKGDFLKKQFDLSDEIEIEHIDWADNYFIPNEL